MPQAPRGKGVVGLEEALELEKGFVVEDDGGKLLRLKAGPLQAEAHRVFREGGVVLFAGEAFLLRGADDLVSADESRGRIVIKGRYAQNKRRFHCLSLIRSRKESQGPDTPISG